MNQYVPCMIGVSSTTGVVSIVDCMLFSASARNLLSCMLGESYSDSDSCNDDDSHRKLQHIHTILKNQMDN